MTDETEYHYEPEQEGGEPLSFPIKSGELDGNPIPEGSILTFYPEGSLLPREGEGLWAETQQGGAWIDGESTFTVDDSAADWSVTFSTYNWEPQPDITAYELAKCLPVLMAPYSFSVVNLPDECQRHFRIEEPEDDDD